MGPLSELLSFYQLVEPTRSTGAAQSSAATSPAEIDLQTLGYDSCLFLTHTGSSVDLAGLGMTLYVGGTTVLSLATSLGSTAAISVATTVANEIIFIDAVKVQHRYVGVTFSETTDTESGGVIAIPYNSRSLPVTASTDVTTGNGKRVVQPTTTS